jgi:NhaA family Na+:H+ antiporter
MAGGGMLAGIGFTMALFIANLAFDQELLDSAKLGIFLASVTSAALGIALLSRISVDGEKTRPGS